MKKRIEALLWQLASSHRLGKREMISLYVTRGQSLGNYPKRAHGNAYFFFFFFRFRGPIVLYEQSEKCLLKKEKGG